MTKLIDNKKVFFENLDGLRFFCFLSVFFYHSFHTDYGYISSHKIYRLIKFDVFGNGNLGVNFFFVLSGFLITYLLIDEVKSNGKINILNFWLRRVLRIWPLFYACVCFGFFVFPVLKSAFGQTPNETANIVYYLTFLNNFDFINNGLPDASILGVLWSVAIEEQFYFCWPLILFVLPVRNYWLVFTAIILQSLVFRFYNADYLSHEHHTLSCIGDMAVGGFGAWLVQQKETIKHRLTLLSRPTIGMIYASFICLYFFRDELLLDKGILSVVERLIIGLVILLIILEQNYSKHSFFKLSKLKTISKLGKITYGLYCLHFIGILITTTLTQKFNFNTHLWQVLVIESLVSLGLTILIATISYKFYEKPFLRLKERFSW